MSNYPNIKDEYNSTPQKIVNLCEIQLSYQTCNIQTPFRITSSRDAEQVFRKMYQSGTIEMREEFKVLFLNRANYVLGASGLFTGGVTGVVADVKIILATAIKSLSSGIILCHNHPSGNLKPSNSDHSITKQIKEACKYFDIVLLDHLILSKDGYSSFADDEII